MMKSLVGELCEDCLPDDASIPKLFQNGLYDIAFLYRSMGIKVMGASEETMLAHHALQPEMIKDLGFLGSVYTDEGAWKHLGETNQRLSKGDNWMESSNRTRMFV